jgi:CRP-like cAMP-binding protein
MNAPAAGVANSLLTRLAQLGGLDGEDLAAVGALCRETRQLRARATLVAQSKSADRLYVLLDGWACTYRLLADGRRQIVALMVPGDILNIDALHLRQTDLAVGSLTACMVAAVSLPAIRALAAERPGVAAALGWLGAVENSMLAERNTCLGRRSAREHVSHLLCELLVRLTVVGRARINGYHLPLTQEEIADVLGLTPVHVNRVVQGLRREGLIEFHSKELVIRQWSLLRQAAGFRADYLHLEGMDGAGRDFSAAPGAFEQATAHS